MGSAKSLQKLHSISSLGVIPAERGDIRVEKLEHRVIPKVPFPHKHDFFQIVTVTQGKGWHEVDFTRHRLSQGQIYFLKPGQVHNWNLSKDTKGFVIEFTLESIPQLNSSLLASLRQIPDCTVPKNIPVEFLKTMENEFLNKDSHFALSLQFELGILLLELIRQNQADKHSTEKRTSVIDGFLDLVESHFREEHSLAFYADRMNISPKALSAQIQKALGKPAKEVLLERCLLEAKRLLAFSDMAVAQISYELGFEDPNYFSRFLKQHGGFTALDFRRQSQKKN